MSLFLLGAEVYATAAGTHACGRPCEQGCVGDGRGARRSPRGDRLGHGADRARDLGGGRRVAAQEAPDRDGRQEDARRGDGEGEAHVRHGGHGAADDEADAVAAGVDRLEQAHHARLEGLLDALLDRLDDGEVVGAVADAADEAAERGDRDDGATASVM